MDKPGDVRETLRFEDNEAAKSLLGENGKHLRYVEYALEIAAHARGNEVTLVGTEEGVSAGQKLLTQLYDLAKRGIPLSLPDIEAAVNFIKDDPSQELQQVFLDAVVVSTGRRRVVPKSPAQKHYVEMMAKYDIVFGIGPAGTGKTYLAVAMAVAALSRREVSRVVLARPAVEAGEKLGFLPGDLAEKVNPYLRPLYDALHDMMEFDRAAKLVEKGVIEVAPLAFMRGRTLNDAFVILDEAQNTTPEQMKMFLTRLGYNSKAVITGDVTQIDLPEGKRSGLKEANDLLKEIEGISFVYFTEQDVVRHKLVQDIIRAYDRMSGSSS
ncbi:MAG: PhoH family protein [Myxococcota bacterium]